MKIIAVTVAAAIAAAAAEVAAPCSQCYVNATQVARREARAISTLVGVTAHPS